MLFFFFSQLRKIGCRFSFSGFLALNLSLCRLGNFFSTNQKCILTGLCSHRSSVWYFRHHSSEVICEKKQWWHPLWNILCFEILRLSKGDIPNNSCSIYEIEGIMCNKQLFMTKFVFSPFSISLQSFYQPSSYNWFICDCASWSFYMCWVGVWRISKARL